MIFEKEDEIFEKVAKIISEQFDVDESEITPETNLFKDLDADSLDLADLLASVEDEFGIEATDEVIETIKTVEDIVSYIDDVKGM
ncbi:MAG: acyl carrier protein [Clostridia bacterium]|nr:acyl carrier protein [Clostridia bacterium]